MPKPEIFHWFKDPFIYQIKIVTLWTNIITECLDHITFDPNTYFFVLLDTWADGYLGLNPSSKLRSATFTGHKRGKDPF